MPAASINGVAVASIASLNGVAIGSIANFNGITLGSPPAESDVLVSGAGTGAANGTYTYTGTHNGKRYYNNVGTATNAFAISWNSGDSRWELWADTGFGQVEAYSGPEDTTYPWQVTAWAELNGDSPAPTVSEA